MGQEEEEEKEGKREGKKVEEKKMEKMKVGGNYLVERREIIGSSKCREE